MNTLELKPNSMDSQLFQQSKEKIADDPELNLLIEQDAMVII